MLCNTKIKEYEANLADAKGYRDRQLKEAKDHMQKMKEKSEKSRKEWEKHEKVTMIRLSSFQSQIYSSNSNQQI